MNVKNLTINDYGYPAPLTEIACPPKQLFYLGADPQSWLSKPRVAVVGSRAVTPYGKQVTAQLTRELTEHGVVIISGLALGIDGVAHEACLEAGGTTVAVLANGLDKIYPASHTQLAKRILMQGGTILSEYPEGTPSFKQQFIARNRIVSGLADVLLITEATERSGTLHTARFALEQGRDVLVVPGNITSPNSVGCNNLIKSGALPVTSTSDILQILGGGTTVMTTRTHRGDNADEQAILDLLYGGTSDGHELLVGTDLPPDIFTQTLTMLELSGKIQPLGNNHWGPR